MGDDLRLFILGWGPTNANEGTPPATADGEVNAWETVMEEDRVDEGSPCDQPA